MWLIWMLGNQDKPMIALILQSAPKKDFAIAKVRESAVGGQIPRLSKEFESINQFLLSAQNRAPGLDISSLWEIKVKRAACCGGD